MADFTQYIGFEADFRAVDSEAQKVGKRAGAAIENSYQRVLARLAGVQNTLGRVSARLEAGFATHVKSTMSSVANTSKSALSSLGGALSGGVVMGISAATGALGDMVEKADSLSKLKVFDPVTYQRLAIVAGKADASISDVEKASLTLNKSLNKAKMPDAFLDALDAAGLSVMQLKAAKPEEQFRMIADAVSKVADPGEQAALALQLFGGTGAKLVPMLKDGGDAIKAIGDQAQKQGRIISQTTIDAAASLNDSIDAIKEPLAGVATQVAGAIIPKIAAGLESVVGFIEANRDEIMAAIDSIVAGIGIAVDMVSRALVILTPVFEVVWEQVQRVVDAFLGLFGGLDEGQETFDTLIATLAEWLIPAIELAGDTLTWLIDHVVGPVIVIAGELWTLLGNIAEAMGLLTEGGGAVGGVLTTIGEIISGTLGKALDFLVGSLRTVISLFNTFTTGSWEDAFLALGKALLDFILQPLRNIVSTVVTIADAISEDLVPQSVRDFANGGGIMELAQEARAPRSGPALPQEIAANTPKAPEPVEYEEGPAYGPELPRPERKGSKPKGKGAGKAKADKADKADKDSLIKIAARGLPGVAMAFDPGDTSSESLPSPAGAAVAGGQAKGPALPTVPELTLALTGATQSKGDSSITVGPITVTVEINGAKVDDLPQTAQTLRQTAHDAVLKALDRATHGLRNRRTT